MSQPLIYLPSNPEPTDVVAKLTPEIFKRRLEDLTAVVENLKQLSSTIKHSS